MFACCVFFVIINFNYLVTCCCLFQSLGNHEFDNGVSGLTPFIENLTCPVLAANLILDKEPALQSEKNLMKSVIFDINDTKIGVIGYLTPDTKILARKNDVGYIEEVVAIREEAQKLEKQGVKILIALGHSGFPKDLEIAKEVKEIDIVIGGHTNTFLWNGTSPDVEKPEGSYPAIVKQDTGRIVLAVQAYAYTKYLGKLNVIFDSDGEVTSFNGNPILLDNTIPQDKGVLSIVQRYQEDVLKISDIVIGNTSVFLDGQSCRVRECNFGNLITDAIVNKYADEYRGGGWTDTPMAVLQGGAIRASVKHINSPSAITKGDLITVMPFDGNIVKMTLNGSVIWEMFEHSVAHYSLTSSPGSFLQVSGLKVEYDLKNRPGQRVVKVLTLCGQCEIPVFKPINKTEVYSILATSFLVNGGDGYSMLKSLSTEDFNYNELDLTIEYINKMGLVHPAVEDRIIIHNIDKLANFGTIPQLSAMYIAFSILTCTRSLIQ